jgi:hypothetical protein
LFEFLSFDEFKFVKMCEDWNADMMMMRPFGRMAAFGRGRPFWAGVRDL